MRRSVAFGAALALAIPAAVGAVGFGPLSKEGVTDGPAKGFYMTVSNPYREPKQFRVYADHSSDGEALPVEIRPAAMRLGARKQRRVLVIMKNLQPGETRQMDVCAEAIITEGYINARVCSKLTARRLFGRAVAP